MKQMLLAHGEWCVSVQQRSGQPYPVPGLVASWPQWTASSTLEGLKTREGGTRGALPGSEVQRVYNLSHGAEAGGRTGQDQEDHEALHAGAHGGHAHAEDGGQEQPWGGAQAPVSCGRRTGGAAWGSPASRLTHPAW